MRELKNTEVENISGGAASTITIDVTNMRKFIGSVFGLVNNIFADIQARFKDFVSAGNTTPPQE